jgi:uncharacterized protein YggT (Ycf19 family)
MGLELALKVLTLLRLVAFMVLFYLAFGLLVERYSRRPDSQLKAFARTICSPITRPVARFLAPGASHARVLVAGMAMVAVFWGVVVVLGAVLRPG